MFGGCKIILYALLKVLFFVLIRTFKYIEYIYILFFTKMPKMDVMSPFGFWSNLLALFSVLTKSGLPPSHQ